MRKLLKAYKTEIEPSKEQIAKIHNTIGTCRYVYNLYIQKNKELYETSSKFISGYDFSKWLNNEYATQEDFKWIKEVSSKAIKQSIMNGDMAFKRFLKKKSGFPNYKKRSDYGSFYLIGTIHVKRHLIQLPTLGKVKLKEKGYIPFNNVKSATVSREADRYYVSVLVEEERLPKGYAEQSDGIGIDLGLKEFLFSSDGESVENMAKSNKIQKLEKSLKRQQRKLSRKIKGSENFKKQKLIIQRLHRKIKNIKNEVKRKTVLSIIKKNPQYITIENLNIKGMMKNRKLSNSFQQIGLGYFTDWLKVKCSEYDIELRRVSRWYPSSQICSCCGGRQPMPLSKREYKCGNCGLEIDRDLNASINLKQTKEYTVLV